jgi:ribosomal protein S18 acetylase RimI-like enzyme
VSNIRELTAADLPQVFEVRVSTVENIITSSRLSELGITPESLAAAIQDSAKGWVCEIEDKIVGFVMGDKSSGELTVLALLPEFEGGGIGKKLLGQVQDWLFAAGYEELWLVTSAEPAFRAYGFYQSQGWQPTGEINSDQDEKFIKRRST